MKKSIFRVKSGEFTDKAFVANLEGGVIQIPWDEIEFASLGVIRERVPDIRNEMSGVRKKLRQVFFREDKHAQKSIVHVRTTYLIDLFLKNSKKIYRFDSSYINYKHFIDNVGLISINNFKNFVIKLCEKLKNTEIDPDMRHFIDNKHHHILVHDSIFDFELHNAHSLKKLFEARLHAEEKKPPKEEKHD